MKNLQIKIAELRTDGIINGTIYAQLDEQILVADSLEIIELEKKIENIEKKYWN